VFVKALEDFCNKHSDVLSEIARARRMIQYAKMTPFAIALKLVIDKCYDQGMKILGPNIIVVENYLTKYFLKNDADITNEQSRYLAKSLIQGAQNLANTAVHKIAGTKKKKPEKKPKATQAAKESVADTKQAAVERSPKQVAKAAESVEVPIQVEGTMGQGSEVKKRRAPKQSIGEKGGASSSGQKVKGEGADKQMSNIVVKNTYKATEAQICLKLDYVFGKSTESTHAIQRSMTMQRSLHSIGVFDNPVGRKLIGAHLLSAFENAKNITSCANELFTKESFLTGPSGSVRVESIWKAGKLISVMIKN
jgi:hypothetical protein